MLDLTSIENSIDAVGIAVRMIKQSDFEKYSKDEKYMIKSGVVQHFEFTYELCWKYMKRILAELAGKYEIDGLSKKDLFRTAAEYGLITDPKVWFSYHEARNLTSHTYNISIADEVAGLSSNFYEDSKNFLKELQNRNNELK